MRDNQQEQGNSAKLAGVSAFFLLVRVYPDLSHWRQVKGYAHWWKVSVVLV